MKIYYMRDNHTFLELDKDFLSAIKQLTNEFDKGYTFGMICSWDFANHIHAKGRSSFFPFLAEVKQLYDAIENGTIIKTRKDCQCNP